VLAAAILDWRARYLQAKGARQRRLIALACLLVLFTGGVVSNQFTTRHTTPQLLTGWLIGLSVTGAVLMSGRWLWVFSGRRTARQRRRILIFLLCLFIGSSLLIGFVGNLLVQAILSWLVVLSAAGVLLMFGFWLRVGRARR